jgi:hypothetical protein
MVASAPMTRRSSLALALAALVLGCRPSDPTPVDRPAIASSAESPPIVPQASAPARGPDPTPRPSKLVVAKTILGKKAGGGTHEAPTVFLHLDARRPGVLVPEKHRSNPQLVLQVGFGMAVPIRDLKIDEQGMSGTLSFDQKPFFCRVPWSAVFGVVGEDGRGMSYPDDTPPEVAAEMAKASKDGGASPLPR